jgi:hypothetical protein
MNTFLLSLLFSSLFTFLLVVPFHWCHPRGGSRRQGTIFLFLLFAVTMQAVGKWIITADPTHSSLPWLASLSTGFILLLLLIALSIPAQKMDKRHESEPGHDKQQATSAFSISFWILLAALILLAF